MEIAKHREQGMKRGFPMYAPASCNPTKFVVKLVGPGYQPWRRVYERWDSSLPSGSRLYSGQPVPFVKVLGATFDLSEEQRAQIGWKLKGYNR